MDALGRSPSVARVTLRVGHDLLTSLPQTALAGAGILAGIDALALHRGLPNPLSAWLPIDPDLSARLTAAIVAVGLIGLAIGLARRKRIAWWAAVLVLGAGLLVQVVMLRHIIGTALTLACLVLLASVRRDFAVDTGRRSRRLVALLWGLGGILAAAGVAVSIGTLLGLVSPATVLQDTGSALVSWVAFGDPGLAVHRHLGGGWLLAMTFLARGAVVAGVLLALAPAEAPVRDPEEDRHAGELAARYGQGALLPFQLGPDTRRFSAPEIDAVLAYGLDARTAVILGDPIGPAAEARRLLGAFLEVCRGRDWRPAIYQASAAALDPLRSLGFLPYPIGREAILDLPDFDLSVPRRANLRHTVTRARRGGLVVEWYPDGMGPGLGGEAATLFGVARTWRLSGRPPLRFTVSGYQPADLVGNPVALAREGDGRLVAFVTFRSTGRDGGWVLDLMRRVPDATPGAVESCIVHAATGLRQRGATTMSLGLAPLSGLDPRSGSPVERGLAVAARAVRGLYDVTGLAFFKAKFDPRWEMRYLAVPGRRRLPAVLLALVRLHAGGARELLRARWRPQATERG